MKFKVQEIKIKNDRITIIGGKAPSSKWWLKESADELEDEITLTFDMGIQKERNILEDCVSNFSPEKSNREMGFGKKLFAFVEHNFYIGDDKLETLGWTKN